MNVRAADNDNNCIMIYYAAAVESFEKMISMKKKIKNKNNKYKTEKEREKTTIFETRDIVTMWKWDRKF